MKVLLKKFYNRSALQVAQDLLGCFLVRQFFLLKKGEIKRGLTQKFKIVETEAYEGPNDLASHASRGKTPRNIVMFGEPGLIYVYLTYGIHYMLNIVTGKNNYPAAVLIRAVEPVLNCKNTTISKPQTNGPAKLTKFLKIDKTFNQLSIYTKKHGLWIENHKEKIKPSQIIKAPRVGIDYAGIYKNKKWRFYLKDNFFVSKK